MKDKRVTSTNITIIILIIGILGIFAIMAWAAFAVVSAVKETTTDALKPVSSVAERLSTQVSQALNPTPIIIPDPITIIHEIRSLARLETVELSVEKVVTAENGQNGALAALFGDRLLFVAHGTIIAGVDMSKLTPKDMWVQNGVLYVRLPAPELFIVTLDNDKSYVYDRNTGLLTKGNTNLETEARRAAENEIEKAAVENNVLDKASKNAESYLSRLFRSLGYADVIFVQPEKTNGK
ncbi:MAG: DUF4230 domain-containing protein [Chloroflexota bacterium]